VVDPTPGPEELLQAGETRDDAWALIASLPPLQQRILELRLADLTGREIAEVLGMSHGAVKAAQFRAFTRLREQLGNSSLNQENP
jgi:RNA polymerase sigma factor (sigma-70 family)